jgi:N-acyl-L-homoserine lactone synthetase
MLPRFRLVLDAFEGGPVVQSDGFTFFQAKSPEERERVYRLRHRLYVEEGYVTPQAFPDQRLHDEFDAEALQLLAVDPAGEPCGTLRIVFDSPRGLPIERVFPFQAPGVARERLVEISRFAIARHCRGGHREVLSGFAKLCHLSIRSKGITHWCAFMPVGFRDSMAGLGLDHEEVPAPPPTAAHREARRALEGYFSRQDVRTYVMRVDPPPALMRLAKAPRRAPARDRERIAPSAAQRAQGL